MAKRESLSKKIRFEVFKRDSFTCQYCGAKSPESILELDHINPIAKGGGNEIMNLVTSCFDCNRGKSDRKISDTSVVEKQRKQIEELNIRRQQLEMMLEWKTGLTDIKNETVTKVSEYITKISGGYQLNDIGLKKLKRVVDKYGLSSSIDAVDTAFDKYFNEDTSEGFNAAFNKIGAIANNNTQPDHIKKISYARGILKNRGIYFNELLGRQLMMNYYECGYDMDALLNFCKIVRNWSQFRDWVSDIDPVSEIINSEF